MKKLFAYSISTLIVLILFEIILRLFGPGVYRESHYKIESNPSNALLSHPNRAFALNPGSYSIQVNKKLEFYTVHDKDSHRIVANNPIQTPKRTIGFYGCSFTYGWGLENNETFPFLLQNEFPEVQIVNMGVPGYGTIQALQQMRSAEYLSKPISDIVVLVYGSFHDHRNALTWQQRRMWASAISRGLQNTELSNMQFPYITNSNTRQIQYENGRNLYQSQFLSAHVALSNFLQLKMESISDKMKGIEDISFDIIQEIQSLCVRHKSTLVVAGILDNEKTKIMLSRLEKLNIPCVNISVDTLNPHYNLSPLDGHPNALANQVYAKKLYNFLSASILQNIIE